MKTLSTYRDFGLLLLRVGIGIMFVFHGLPKLIGGPEHWAGLGAVIGKFGITFFPEFWGFMAGFSEFAGGLSLILGFKFRPALFLLLIAMVIASFHHVLSGDDFSTSSHAIEAAILFLSLIFIGPGKYSLDEPK